MLTRSNCAIRKQVALAGILLVSLAMGLPAQATLGLGALAGGTAATLARNPLGLAGGALGAGTGSLLNSAENLVGGISRNAAAHVGAALGADAGLAATGTAAGAAIGSVVGAAKAAKTASAINAVNNVVSGPLGAVQGLAGGFGGLGGGLAGGLGGLGGLGEGLAGGLGGLGGGLTGSLGGLGGLGGALGGSIGGLGSGLGGVGAAVAASQAAASVAPMAAAAAPVAALAAHEAVHSTLGAVETASAVGAAAGAAAGAATAANAASIAGEVASVAPMGAAPLPPPITLPGLAPGVALGAAQAAAASSPIALASLVNKPALVADALSNARAEASIAGADMVAHGANNARSASLASNAYRQAKLASARDKVNIAGTIQNSARISDAAIATHDAATKAEDSLLGSELAVDSAATVLDSDAAYIPPVTNSLLRSLPYGRLGLRNIVPKPLTYPSVLLPDVWLNGAPVNYMNVPLRMLPYSIGPNGLPIGAVTISGPLGLANGAPAVAAAGAFGQAVFQANNGILVNGMVVDPAVAYQLYGQNGIISSSIFPVLANGQIEASDEIALNGAVYNSLRNGAGTSATYAGFGRLNGVGMITGRVSNSNLMPTTAIGTTYPIGSALVIEPRDSYFQDYIDSASSRNNFDERQQS